MDEIVAALHVLTPLSTHTPQLLDSAAAVACGDFIADFRRFPPSVWQVGPGGRLDEITARLVQSRDYWTPVREWLIEFTAQTGLQDILQIDGYGVWWTLNAQKFVPGLTEVGNAFVWIDLLKAIAREASPTAVTIHGRHEAILHLAGQIFSAEATQILEAKDQRREPEGRPPRRPLLLLARIVLGTVYLIYSFFRRPDVCALSNTNLMRRTTEGSDEGLRDVYLGQVISSLRRRGWSVAVAEKYGWNASWAGLMARGFCFPSDIIYALTSPLFDGLRHRLSKAPGWPAAWPQIQPLVKPHLRYHGCDITLLLLPVIADQFTWGMSAFESLTQVWRRILAFWDPKVIYVNNAYGAAALAPIIAAKSLNIPTIEQQHGVIGRNHFAYLVPTQLDSSTKLPICDRMAVWGEYTKCFLVDHQVYEPGDLTVTGFPRIDGLLEDLPVRRDTLEAFGVTAEASAVLYTPNKFAEAFRSPMLDSIEAVGDTSGIQWIIKPHPAMKTSSIWQEAIDQRHLEMVVVVSGDADFYALLSACDVHVTFASTTLIEAAVLGKPNVGLCTPSTVDPAGYMEAGAFLPVHPSDVGSVVKQLLSNAEWQAELLTRQKLFATEWCLHDGRAVARITELIEAVAAPSSGRRK